jgi:hypothetical protein
MRRLLAPLVLVLLGGFATAETPDIRSDSLMTHIKFLAADDMRGRANGTPELERAGDYVAQQFKAAGLQPGWKGDWWQPFELIAGLTISGDNHLSITAGGKSVRVSLGTSYYPLGANANDDPAVASSEFRRLPLVFAGYGLTVPNLGYDDYAHIDVSGKAVLIFSHEPQEHDPKSRFNGTRFMPQTTLQAKAAAAQNKGARALLVISDPSHKTDEANYRLFGLDPNADNVGIPVLRVRRDEMQPLIAAWGLDAVAREIDADAMPRSKVLPGATADYVEHLSRNRRTVRNVVGILPGSDSTLAKEAVVIGAHYDHVGIGGRLSVTPERTGEIHNGADDNASGTASIIEIARAAAADRSRFPRTLVFVAFAGEERGLLGSSYYAGNPAVPIDSTIAMINLDMVGRSRGGVDVSGIELAPALEEDLNTAARSSKGLEIRRQGPGAGRSDDSSFIDRRVPAINFFTGFHGDYHRPTDDWDKIDAEGTKRVATLALELAAHIAERATRPEFVAPASR